MSDRLYAYPNVGSYGLGHSLLAFARCVLWGRDHGVPVLAPSWFHIRHRIGPILRRERDKRQYQLLFRFPKDYVTGLKRRWVLSTATRVAAEDADLATVLREPGGRLVVFSNRMAMNEETNFHEVRGRGLAVRRELLAITKPRHVPSAPVQPEIAVHVRMGDFRSVPNAAELRAGAKNARLPVEWYAGMLRGLRARLGKDAAAVVFSDGDDAALAPLLSLPAVRRSPGQSAIADLLSMSQCRALISSGSGFSMWGAFLGDMPRLCHPGQRLVRVLTLEELDREPECESAAELPQALIEHIRSRLAPA